MPVPRGLLNKTLILQSYALTADGMGGQTAAWTDIGSFRARVSPISAQGRMMQDKETMTTTHRIFCDPMSVMSNDRIKWDTYYFEITGITNPSELYHHLEIDVKEINYP